ncbi:MAG: glycosyltransferase family 4 protein [Gaiellales bacterium]
MTDVIHRPFPARGTGGAAAPSRMVVHDFAGHPFPVELSRALAERGHQVLHLHCASDVTGKGAVTGTDRDPRGFRVEGIQLDSPFDKYRPAKRARQEFEYGRQVAARVRGFRPDAVISANTPLIALTVIQREVARARARFVFWQQDVLSLAMTRFYADRVPVAGPAMAAGFRGLERRLLRRADSVIAISDDFVPLLNSWGVRADRVSVIENWAPLDELPVQPRDNAWSDEHGLRGMRTVLYAGTMGMKHNPELLVRVAERFADEPDVRVVVVSQGRGADYMREQAGLRGLHNVIVLPYQPYERLPEVLASGDVLVALLEADAGVFSVPSKVLSYHCAGRPLLAAVPSQNLAARVISRAGSGVVVDPHDVAGFVSAAERLLTDEDARRLMAAAGRAYAESRFDVGRLAGRFESAMAVNGVGSPA